MDLVRSWWKELEGGKGVYNISLTKIAEFLVKKGVASDRERAKEIIYKS